MKEVIQMSDKKKGNCGCGCRPPTSSRSRTEKKDTKKPKK